MTLAKHPPTILLHVSLLYPIEGLGFRGASCKRKLQVRKLKVGIRFEAPLVLRAPGIDLKLIVWILSSPELKHIQEGFSLLVFLGLYKGIKGLSTDIYRA